MLFYQNTLTDIEAVRKYAAAQNYDSLKYHLSKFQFELNIDDAEDCRVSTNWEEHRLYSCYIALKTIDKIRAGASIVNMSFIGLITSYWVVPHNPTNEINCEPKGVDYFDIETEIDEEEILHGYDLRRFFFVYYALSDVSIRASILDKLIWELGLRDSKDDPDSVVVLEYLTRFRELIQSQPEQTLQKQPQEQIYSISTNLTEKQLIALLGRLKDNGFVAPEQTEEDFLNAFNPNATKQGKIEWVKFARNKAISPKQIVNFCNLMAGGKWLAQQQNAFVVELLSAVFDIFTDNKRISSIRNDGSSEYDIELQSYINIARK